MIVRRIKQMSPVPLTCGVLGFSLLLVWLGIVWAQDTSRTELVSCVKQLEANDARLRKAAARMLGELADADAVPFLAETLRQDSVAAVRQAAAEALGRIRHADAVSTLTHTLQHDDALGVRLAATRALGQIDYPSVHAALSRAMQQDKAAHVRRLAARMLGRLRAQTAASVLTQTLRRDEDAGVRQAAAEALEQIGNVAVVPALIHTLWHDRDLGVRLTVVQRLGQMSHPGVVPVLTRALRQASEPLVRQAAAQALGQIGDQAAVASLMQTLRQAQDATDRQTAAGLLGQFGAARGPSVVPVLVQALRQDPAPQVRRIAVRSLGQIGDPGMVSVVAAVLRHDGAADVRRMAARALGQLGGVSTLQVLRDTLQHDAAPEVQQAATEAMLRIVYPIRNRAATLSSADLRNAIEALQDVPRLLQERISTGVLDIGKEWAAALYQSHATLTAQLVARNKWRGLAILAWLYQHPWWWGPVLYIAGLLCLWLAFLWLHPLWLLRLNDALQPYTDFTLPACLGNMRGSLRYVLLIGFFHYHRRVLDAWIKAHVHGVRENFGRLETVKARAAYVPMPLMLYDGVSEQELFDPHVEDFREFFLSPATVLLIQGEEGVGKTSLACQLAVSALHPDPQMRLCSHLILPVLLEDDVARAPGQDVNMALSDAVRHALAKLLNASRRLSADLVSQLLRQRRILLIVDHLSEMDAATRDVIKPQRDGFPARLVIVTSSLVEQLGDNMQHIVPQRLASTHLAGFVDAYLILKQVRHRLDDATYFDLCHRLASLAGKRDLSVLLARMFIDQALAAAPSSDVVSKVTPRNMPELIQGHLNRLYRSAAADTPPSAEVLEDTAKQVAWECVKETMRSTRIHVSAIQSLLADRIDDLQWLIDLGLLVRGGADHAWVRFALASIADYLAGFYLVEQYGESETLWREFLTRAQAVAAAPQSMKTFLLALHDCCAIMGPKAGVPDFVLLELSKCANLDSDIIASEQFEQRLRHLMRKLIAPQVADRRGAAVALGGMGADAKTAVFALSQALLDDTDPIVRQTAVWALGRIRSKAAILVLAQILLKATDVAIRQTAAETLGRIRSETSISVLTRIRLNDPNPMMRQTAAEVLSKMETASEAVSSVLNTTSQPHMSTSLAISDKALLKHR